MANPSSIAEMADLELNLSDSDESLLNYINPETVVAPTATVRATFAQPDTETDTESDTQSEPSVSFSGVDRTLTSGRAIATRFDTSAPAAPARFNRAAEDTATVPTTTTPTPVATPVPETRVQRQNTGQFKSKPSTTTTTTTAAATSAPVVTNTMMNHYESGTQNLMNIETATPAARTKSNERERGASILKNPMPKPKQQKPHVKAKPHRRNSVPISDDRDAAFDLDGDGELDEIEQAMRDRDVDGDGQLDNAEVYRIIQDQLKSQTDYKLYKRVAAGLLCLVAILSVSHLGTSMAAVMLSRETVADKDSGTIQTKSGDVMGYQAASHLIDLEELSDDEFDERRRLVDAEMAEDPDHPDHLHRRLAKKKGKGKGDVTKIAYDHGKVKQKDLVELKRKCNGANTVQMRRKWRGGDIMDNGSYDEDFDILCAPGTVVKEKGKKKNNKNKSKTQVVNELITFERKGRGGQTVSQTFTCPNRGEDCFSSGENLHQREGHPCNIQRDFVGVSECIPGLACYNRNDHSAKKGNGQCTKLQRFARQNQICDVTLEVDACVSEYACYSQKGRTTKVSVGTVSTGICNRVTQLARANEVCDVSFKANACIGGYRCLSKSGRDIGKKGIGFCTRSSGGSGGSSGNIAKFAQKDQPCNTKHGFNACASGYACYSINGPGGGGTGRCELVRMRESPGGICLDSYGADSCVWGSQCVLSRGASRRANYGECRSIGGNGGNGGGNGNDGGGNGGRGNGVAGGARGNSGGGCLPNGASFADDCTNNRSCSGRKTCLKNCTPGSDRWFCY